VRYGYSAEQRRRDYLRCTLRATTQLRLTGEIDFGPGSRTVAGRYSVNPRFVSVVEIEVCGHHVPKAVAVGFERLTR